MTARMWAIRFHCMDRDSSGIRANHSFGNGKPARQKCRLCGGRLVTEQGLWGVFTWTQSGRYPAGAAKSTHIIETIAQRHADKAAGLVVRWIRKDDAQPGPPGQPCGCRNLAGDCDGDHTAAGEADPR